MGQHYRSDDDPPQDWWPKYLSLGAVANPFAAAGRMWRTRWGRIYLALDAFFALVFLQAVVDGPEGIDGPVILGCLGSMMLVITLVLSGDVLKTRVPDYFAQRDNAFVVLGWCLIALGIVDLVT